MLSAGATLHSITFPSARVGYAVGDGGAFYATTDGGATWTRRDVGLAPPPNLVDVRCATPTMCLVGDDRGDLVLRTVDAGVKFSAVATTKTPVTAIAFASIARAVAVGPGGDTLVFDDGGASFTAVSDALAGPFARLWAGTSGGAYAAGDKGALARSVDGGQTWSSIGVPTYAAVTAVSFPSQQVGYALDAGVVCSRRPTAARAGSACPPAAVRRRPCMPRTRPPSC